MFSKGPIRLLPPPYPVVQQTRARSRERQAARPARAGAQVQALGRGDGPAGERQLHLQREGRCGPDAGQVRAQEAVGLSPWHRLDVDSRLTLSVQKRHPEAVTLQQYQNRIAVLGYLDGLDLL